MIEFRSLAGNKVKLMAKLEKPSAIDYLDEVKLLINMRRLYSFVTHNVTIEVIHDDDDDDDDDDVAKAVDDD
jgi:hypothetical protein